LRGRIVLPAVFRLHECVPSPEARLVSTLSRVKALSALFSFPLRNPNWLSNLHLLAIIAWFKEPYATLVLFVATLGRRIVALPYRARDGRRVRTDHGKASALRSDRRGGGRD
jgi:hypothetical protein